MREGKVRVEPGAQAFQGSVAEPAQLIQENLPRWSSLEPTLPYVRARAISSGSSNPGPQLGRVPGADLNPGACHACRMLFRKLQGETTSGARPTVPNCAQSSRAADVVMKETSDGRQGTGAAFGTQTSRVLLIRPICAPTRTSCCIALRGGTTEPSVKPRPCSNLSFRHNGRQLSQTRQRCPWLWPGFC